MSNRINVVPDILGATPSPQLAWTASGIDGAGFINTIAIDPNSTGLVLCGGDVSGIQRSIDWGANWEAANGAATGTNHLRVATIAFHPTVANKVYAGMGNDGAGGGFFRSTDGGLTWTLASTTPQFGGDNSNVVALPSTHPRSTGRLITAFPGGIYLYAATFNDGVMRSADDGNTWTTLGLSGLYLRSLALDPSNPDVLYASSYGDKVYKTTTARGAGTFTALAASPTSTEELLVVGGAVYAAAGPLGVFKSTNGGSTWTQLGAGVLETNGPVWESIDGYVSGGQTVLFAGNVNPNRINTSSGFDTVYKSTDSGATWASITRDLTDVHFTEGGPSGVTWWLSDVNDFLMVNGGSFVAAQIAVDAADRNRIFVCGRSGLWASTDGGTAWYPMVKGLNVTINRDIKADPNVDGRVYVANTDWVLLSSDDSLESVVQTRPPVPAIPAGSNVSAMALSVALDTAATPSVVYAAVGNRNNNDSGDIYSKADPLAAGSWTSSGLGAVTGGKRPLAVAVRRIVSTVSILAAVEASGIWRKVGSGTWQRVSAVAMAGTQSTKSASFAWGASSDVVFCYDRQTGVYRSIDNGGNWTLIWAKPSAQDSSGYVAVDDADPTTLYVSVLNDDVYRIDGANVGTVGAGTLTPVPLTTFTKPGPICCRDGVLYATQVASGSSVPLVIASSNKGVSWVDLTDDVFTIGARFPFAISASNGSVYVSLNGDGGIRRLHA